MAPNPSSHPGRIAAVDGLRAAAVLGVIWAHVWTHCGNPAFSLGSIRGVSLDLNRLISLVGSGVDLFFVISGFCMFWIYARKNLFFDNRAYLLLLKSRWLRIAPAFYIASIVCAVGWWVVNDQFPWKRLACHFLFLNGVLPGSGNLAAPFWSLATEWQFYVVLPLICYLALRLGFSVASFLVIISCVGFRVYVWFCRPEWRHVFENHLPFRVVEFVWGIMVAHLFAGDKAPPFFLRGSRGLLFGLAVAYIGRCLRMTEFIHFAAALGPLCGALAEPVMSMGFALMLWSSISGRSFVLRGLCHRSMVSIGRWSYSIYLWHWYPSIWISHIMIRHYGSTAFVQYLAFAITLAVVVPFSRLSYTWLEAFYFQAKRHA